MGKNTKISWSNHTWGPVSGCTQISPGCDNCYALTIAERFRGSKAYPNGFDITLRPHKLKDPLKWKKPARIFVNSMSDMFHKDIPKPFIKDMWDTMMEADWHTYQILTKRPHRMEYTIKELGLPLTNHIWLGVSAENQEFWNDRVLALAGIDTPVRFVSAEPLLGPIDMGWLKREIDWCVVGGESGYGFRSMNLDWARSLRDQCVEGGVSFFFKQGSHRYPGKNTYLDGRTWEEYPIDQRQGM